MLFFTPTQLDIAMHIMPKRMTGLGNRLTLPNDPAHGQRADVFRAACENRQCDVVNQMLDEAVAGFLGTGDVIYALGLYLTKFGVAVSNLSLKSDTEILRTVAANRAVILERLDQEGI